MSSQAASECLYDLGEADTPSLSRVRAARRQCILDSALQTFLRDGYHGATMDRVAEDACVSKQTLYNYFADKEELFIALIEERKTERIHATLGPALAEIAAGDVEGGLRAAAQALLCNAADADLAALFRLVMELAVGMPELTARLRERIRDRVFLPTFNLVREALDRAAAAGAVRCVDTEVTARAFFGAIATSTLLHSLLLAEQPDPLPPERLAAGLADILSNGLTRRA